MALLLVASMASAAPPSEGGRKGVEPRADEVLRGMNDYLARLQAFTLKTETTLESVEQGQKVKRTGSGELQVMRPGRLHAERTGELGDVDLWYDGKTLTVLAKGANVYAQTPAPPDLDDMLVMAAERLELYPPGADLLSSKSREVLLSDVVSVSYAGQTELDGVPVHHLVLRGNEVDSELWVEAGERPVPRRYKIVSKRLPMKPEYVVTTRDWDVSPKLDAQQFTFQPPKGAQKTAFLAASSQPVGQGRKGVTR